MTGRVTLLPLMLIVTVVVLTLIVMSEGGEDLPDVVVDDRYAHYICTMNAYCIDNDCDRSGNLHFVAYPAHENGRARLEFPGMAPRAQLVEDAERHRFISEGGQVKGTVSIFRDGGGLDMVGFSGDEGNPVEHYASGNCGRLRQP